MAKRQVIWDIIIEQPMGTLPALEADLAVSTAIGVTAGMLKPFRILKTEYEFNYEGSTVGQGPVIFGAAIGLTKAQIEETITSRPTSDQDLDESDDANRAVWFLDSISPTGLSDGSGNGIVGIREWKPRWTVQKGEDLQWFAFNADDQSLATGTLWGVTAKHYGLFLENK